MVDNYSAPGTVHDTMLAERIDFEVSYKQFERAALQQVETGEWHAARTWLDELGEHIDHLVQHADLDVVARWSARLDRLADNLPQGPLTERTVGYLSAMLHRLDRRAAALAQRHDVEARGETAVGVRDRVRTYVLEQPRCRTGEIADRLDISLSQASRALRELQQRGLVFRAEPEPTDHDRRVHRFVVADVPRHAHAA